jgi:phosphohistidine swiveling domain-containing protein
MPIVEIGEEGVCSFCKKDHDITELCEELVEAIRTGEARHVRDFIEGFYFIPSGQIDQIQEDQRIHPQRISTGDIGPEELCAMYALLIIQNQIGSLSRYLQHDPKVNPDATPFGSPQDEKCTIGESIVHLLRYALYRGFPPQECLDLGVKRIGSKDWERSDKVEREQIKGNIIVRTIGIKEGRAFLFTDPPSDENLKKAIRGIHEGDILVTPHFSPEMSVFLGKVGGIVTDHGGKLCHAAKVATEFQKKHTVYFPVVVGTGNATQFIAQGERVRIDLQTGLVRVGEKREEHEEEGTGVPCPSCGEEIVYCSNCGITCHKCGTMLKAEDLADKEE